jgi:two-component system phosphate regulon sensor histidine kinase PhoR
MNLHGGEEHHARLAREFSALLEQCGSAVLVMDARGCVERANAASHVCLLLPPVFKEVRNLLEEACTNGSRTREVSTPGGGSLMLSITPIRGELPPRFLVVARDISELRRLEKIRRDFVANVSHELRTPLASIRAMAETLQDGALRDESVADQFLGTMVTEVQRLTRISEDLLILSDAESRTPETAPFSLSELMKKVLTRFRPQAEKVSIKLLGRIPPRLKVEANHDQIEQVLVNLVDNAIKYTPSGGRVELAAEPQAHCIAVHVKDTGIGIQSRDLPRIFERFYRVDKARSRQSGGTGLGLSIVKHIVESHGGQLTVASEFNRGSTFTFTLPIESAASTVSEQQEASLFP